MFDEMIFQIFGGYSDPVMVAECFLLSCLVMDAFVGLFGAIFTMGGKKRC